MKNAIEIVSELDPGLRLRVIPGHFFSDRYHMNYYVDLAALKMKQQEAEAVARAMCKKYISRVRLNISRKFNTQLSELEDMLTTKAPIDTIVCLDGCEVIGAYVARELSEISEDKLTHSSKRNFYVITPEFDSTGQMIIRDNMKSMIQGRNVLIVLALAMSGKTILKSIRSIESYGGKMEGVSVIFGAIDNIEGYPVHAVFDAKDLPDFRLSLPEECPDCKAHVKMDAIVTSYGYTVL
ncbi:MAG: orotate phosphoribosyltransferase [Blautia sp.]|jgi:orotate phosphoribosyltransferase